MKLAEPIHENRVEQQHAGNRETLLHERTVSLRDLGKAASFFAHELRQPLGTIQNLAVFLKATVGSDNPAVLESLLLLEQQAQFAGEIISSLAGFARTGAPARTPTQLHRALKAVLKRISWRPEISLEQELAPRLPAVFADALHVDRILSNVVANALESMPGPGTLIIVTRTEATCILLEVTDTGRGIEPELAGQIFQPFVTTKPNGTGLGLALCRELAQANGGSIGFKSQPGIGTTFQLRLPKA